MIRRYSSTSIYGAHPSVKCSTRNCAHRVLCKNSWSRTIHMAGRVAPGNCTPRPSRPGESHPEALTDPCLSLSAHTAPAIHGELAVPVTTRRVVASPVDQSEHDVHH